MQEVIFLRTLGLPILGLGLSVETRSRELRLPTADLPYGSVNTRLPPSPRFGQIARSAFVTSATLDTLVSQQVTYQYTSGHGAACFLSPPRPLSEGGPCYTLRELKAQELEMIEDSLSRIEKGAYGHCRDCGRWISMGMELVQRNSL